MESELTSERSQIVFYLAWNNYTHFMCDFDETAGLLIRSRSPWGCPFYHDIGSSFGRAEAELGPKTRGFCCGVWVHQDAGTWVSQTGGRAPTRTQRHGTGWCHQDRQVAGADSGCKRRREDSKGEELDRAWGLYVFPFTKPHRAPFLRHPDVSQHMRCELVCHGWSNASSQKRCPISNPPDLWICCLKWQKRTLEMWLSQGFWD